MIRPCKCGHRRQAHYLRNGGCGGVCGRIKNPSGVRVVAAFCDCPIYRPTERTWWQYRITLGTEELEERRA